MIATRRNIDDARYRLTPTVAVDGGRIVPSDMRIVPSDMTSTLPAGLELARTTAEFDEHTVPAGLLRDHRIAAGVWGRLVVTVGALQFAFSGDDEIRVAAGETVVIPPQQVHHVRVDGAVRFHVEFHRPPDTVAS